MSCSLLNFKISKLSLLLLIETGGRKLTSKKEKAKSKVDNVKYSDSGSDKKVESDKLQKKEVKLLFFLFFIYYLLYYSKQLQHDISSQLPIEWLNQAYKCNDLVFITLIIRCTVTFTTVTENTFINVIAIIRTNVSHPRHDFTQFFTFAQFLVKYEILQEFCCKFIMRSVFLSDWLHLPCTLDVKRCT